MALLLKKSTLYYRESTSDPWTPFIMSADANFVDFADEYSDSQTYAVGEYCRYDGDFWRCTTAITTAEAWDSTHWTKTTIGAEFQRYLPLTAGAGKPLTGSLSVVSGGNPSLILRNTDVDTSASSASEIRYTSVAYKDAYDRYAAYCEAAFTTTGESQLTLRARKLINGNNVNNGIWFGVRNDGSRFVGIDGAAEWRSALGLGTSGNLPIAIAQGGTGQTEVTSDTTISNIFSAASGFTCTEAKYFQWGKVAQVRISVKKTTAVTTPTDMTIGTIVAGKRPAAIAGVVVLLETIDWAYINANGDIHIKGTLTSTASAGIHATYLLP